MKRKFILINTLFTLLVFILPAYGADTYVIDPNHTYILWHISHFGFSEQTGKWMPQGTIIFDEEKLQNSKVNITVHVEGMVTGIEELNKHLKGKMFFDIEKYPLATFVSDKVTIIHNKTAKIHGILTVHGVSKPIILDAKLNKYGINPMTKKKTLGFSAHTQLKRSDFGIKTALPNLGDEVKLDIQGEATKK